VRRGRLRASLCAALIAAGCLTAVPVQAAARAPERVSTTASAQASTKALSQAHTVTYDRYAVRIDGKRVFLRSGEFPYWRPPSPDLCRDVLLGPRPAGA
jgi:beta-galactosidase